MGQAAVIKISKTREDLLLVVVLSVTLGLLLDMKRKFLGLLHLEQAFATLWIKHQGCSGLQLQKAGMMIPVVPSNSMVWPSLIPCTCNKNGTHNL